MDESPMGQSVNCEIHKELKTQHVKGDRISNLPDHVLVHIISLLPIWSAVATSVLSKRWKNVWTGIHALYLTDVADRLKSHEDHTSFGNFLDKVLLCEEFCRLQLVEFSLSGEIDRTHASEWITLLMKRGMRELRFSNEVEKLEHIGENEKLMVFSPSFYSSHTLVELMLSGDIFVRFPVSLQFPFVKVVSMVGIHFLDGTSVRNLLSGSPVLENLSVSECNGEGDIDVHSYSLKKLRINYLYCSEDDVVTINAPNLHDLDMDVDCSYVIRAPNVRHLSVLSFYCLGENFEMNYMPSLEDAHLNFEGTERGLLEALRSVRSVRSLTLEDISMLKDNVQGLPVFSNLTFLEVTISSWPIVAYLLELSPNLKHLCANFRDINTPEWSFPPRVPDCILALEVFQIVRFDGDAFMLKLAQYIFSNAKLLQEMIMCVSWWDRHLINPLKETLAEMALQVSCDCKISSRYCVT